MKKNFFQRVLSAVKNPTKIVMYMDTKGMLSALSDTVYLKLVFRARMGQKLNLKEPKTFNEKLQWLKIYDRKSIYTKIVDKFEAKKYVAELIGDEYIIPTLGVWDKFEDIDFSKLPNQFVLKCTHDSGGVVICEDKSKLDLEAAKKKINKFLKRNYYYSGREWPYRNVKPRIICEKYMVDESGVELKDYKIFCFGGEPKIVQVDYNRFIKHNRNLYDINWNYIPAYIQYPTDPNVKIKKPEKLKNMLELASKLAKNFPHVRVDLYSINDKIYFGEMTFYHGSGFEKFGPEEFGIDMGMWINLPK